MYTLQLPQITHSINLCYHLKKKKKKARNTECFSVASVVNNCHKCSRLCWRSRGPRPSCLPKISEFHIHQTASFIFHWEGTDWHQNKRTLQRALDTGTEVPRLRSGCADWGTPWSWSNLSLHRPGARWAELPTDKYQELLQTLAMCVFHVYHG